MYNLQSVEMEMVYQHEYNDEYTSKGMPIEHVKIPIDVLIFKHT